MQHRIDGGSVIRRVLQIYVDQASVLMPAAAVVFVFTGIIAALLIVASPGLALLALLIDLVAGTLFTGMVVELVADVQDGRRDSSPGQLLRAVTPVLGQLILVGILAAIGIVIGFIFIIVPGLYLITVWSVAAPVVVLENPGALAALSRSRELVRGNGWQVFGVILVLYVLVGVVSFIVEGIAESAGSGAGIVVRVIVGVLTAPLASLAAAVLYFELGGAAPAADSGIGDTGSGGADPGEPPSGGGSDAERAFGG
jgi:ABC-type multidrug transport system fused ATPase/permease subunit